MSVIPKYSNHGPRTTDHGPSFHGCCLVFVICLLLLLPLGCSHTGPNVYVRKGSDQSTVRKVAVFKFRNSTKAAEASKIATSFFMAGLVETGRFQVELPGNIRSFLVGERIIIRTGVDLDTMNVMGKRLGVDAVILGSVEEFVGAAEAKRAVEPSVFISSRMVDAKTGQILWMAQHGRKGDDYTKVLDFGKVRSVGALTKKVVEEMIQTMP